MSNKIYLHKAAPTLLEDFDVLDLLTNASEELNIAIQLNYETWEKLSELEHEQIFNILNHQDEEAIAYIFQAIQSYPYQTADLGERISILNFCYQQIDSNQELVQPASTQQPLLLQHNDVLKNLIPRLPAEDMANFRLVSQTCYEKAKATHLQKEDAQLSDLLELKRLAEHPVQKITLLNPSFEVFQYLCERNLKLPKGIELNIKYMRNGQNVGYDNLAKDANIGQIYSHTLEYRPNI